MRVADCILAVAGAGSDDYPRWSPPMVEPTASIDDPEQQRAELAVDSFYAITTSIADYVRRSPSFRPQDAEGMADFVVDAYTAIRTAQDELVHFLSYITARGVALAAPVRRAIEASQDELVYVARVAEVVLDQWASARGLARQQVINEAESRLPVQLDGPPWMRFVPGGLGLLMVDWSTLDEVAASKAAQLRAELGDLAAGIAEKAGEVAGRAIKSAADASFPWGPLAAAGAVLIFAGVAVAALAK